MQAALVVVFWLSFAGLFHTYIGYPLFVYLGAKFTQSTRRTPLEHTDHDLPEVTVLIAAFNAEQLIHQRIKNILACDYPAHRLRILLASDGSTDSTVSIVENFCQPSILAISFVHRRGKCLALSDAIRQISSEVVLLTDASTHFDRTAIRNLVRHFVDPRVGLVTGRAAIVDENGDPSESLYWRCEMSVRRSESQLGIMLGASGAIWAVRQKLFVEPRRPVINDDLVLPMLVRLRHGCEIVHDETAIAYAISSGGIFGEYHRRCRIGAGAFQCLPILSELLHWRHFNQAIAFASHKLLRWLSPFLLGGLIITNMVLSPIPFYGWFLCAQAGGYLLSVLGLFAPKQGHFPVRLARAASAFLVMNVAFFTGFCRWLIAPHNVIWNPTPRPLLEATHMVLRNEKRTAA